MANSGWAHNVLFVLFCIQLTNAASPKVAPAHNPESRRAENKKRITCALLAFAFELLRLDVIPNVVVGCLVSGNMLLLIGVQVQAANSCGLPFPAPGELRDTVKR
jgi:hypothetical protein